MARRRMYGSATSAIWMAESTRVAWPWCSRASCRARALITVPSMPMASDVARSIPAPAPVVPRQMLPPPDHHGQLEVEIVAGTGDLHGQLLDDGGVDGLVGRRGGEGLPGHLQDNAPSITHR